MFTQKQKALSRVIQHIAFFMAFGLITSCASPMAVPTDKVDLPTISPLKPGKDYLIYSKQTQDHSEIWAVNSADQENILVSRGAGLRSI